MLSAVNDNSGKMFSALSDSYLPAIGLEEGGGGVGAGNPALGAHPAPPNRLISPEEGAGLFALSREDRHPSAPHLVSMLTSDSSGGGGVLASGIKSEVMMSEEEVCERKEGGEGRGGEGRGGEGWGGVGCTHTCRWRGEAVLAEGVGGKGARVQTYGSPPY